MIMIGRIGYLLLVGYLVYRMIKKGGCCGGHGSHDNDEQHRNCEGKGQKTEDILLTENDKKDAIDI